MRQRTRIDCFLFVCFFVSSAIFTQLSSFYSARRRCSILHSAMAQQCSNKINTTSGLPSETEWESAHTHTHTQATSTHAEAEYSPFEIDTNFSCVSTAASAVSATATASECYMLRCAAAAYWICRHSRVFFSVRSLVSHVTVEGIWNTIAYNHIRLSYTGGGQRFLSGSHVCEWVSVCVWARMNWMNKNVQLVFQHWEVTTPLDSEY